MCVCVCVCVGPCCSEGACVWWVCPYTTGLFLAQWLNIYIHVSDELLWWACVVGVSSM